MTLIVDLIRRLMSRGLSLDAALEEAEIAEAAAISSGPKPGTREYERIRKANYRAAQSQIDGTCPMGGTTTKPLVQNSVSKKKKNPSPEVPGQIAADGWPEDFLDQFWKAFPPFRREAKRKVAEKLARCRSSGVVSWEQMIGAVNRFAATDPGQYAPAPMVWLNGERWDREYGSTKTGGSNETNRNGNSRGGFSNIAARIRHGNPDAERAAGQQPPAGEEPNHRY